MSERKQLELIEERNNNWQSWMDSVHGYITMNRLVW